jgi:anti-anti-sigma factor
MNSSQDPIFLEIDDRGDTLVITPHTPELTYKNSKQFLDKSKNAIDLDRRLRIILNLEHIDIIDSMSLGTLMALLKHVRKFGNDMVVANLSDPIKELFKLLNFNTVFLCFKSVQDALDNA